jgi:hypothetical protein
MVMRIVVAVVALLLAATLPARSADILATGPGYGSDSQAVARCYLYNAGGTSVRVSSVRIIRENTGPVPVNCNCGTLASQHECECVAAIINSAAHACKAVVSDKTNIRGTFVIFPNSEQTVLYSEVLR